MPDGSAGVHPHHRLSLSATFGRAGESRPEAAVVGSAVRELLDGIVESQPVCIAADDTHRLNEPTTDVLTFAMPYVRDARN
ncbi:hypothetical protein ABZ814_18475 [Micromonospora musae]|uniref:hypothetical protein n=1 Tax=Micromonospora musae TaxID=1894970 RepID=UPI0033CE16E4